MTESKGMNNHWNNNLPYSPGYYELREERKSLPIWESKKRFLKLLKKHQIVIVGGDCGGGKTTQIPQFVLDAVDLDTTDKGSKTMVSCTQPSTAAVVSVARRVSKEMDVTLGKAVGYHTQIKNKTSTETVLKFMTNGMLLSETVTDPLLTSYKFIVLDEAHQRTLSRDLLFGLLKDLVLKRPDLKLVVIIRFLNDTLDSDALEKLKDFFCGASYMEVDGKFHQVDFFYKKPKEDYVNAAINMVVKRHVCEPPGDILVFLTNWEEVEGACEKISEEIASLGDDVGPVVVVPLHSNLTPKSLRRTLKATAPSPLKEGGPVGRKIIVATNIAETSLTIDGIVYVIDTGFTEMKDYNSDIRVESLMVTPISQASARQRALCAGRTGSGPGKCFRLYKHRFLREHFQPETTPEISRSNFVKTVLILKKLGIDEVERFSFTDPVHPKVLSQALDILNKLGALDVSGSLTDLGKVMSEFPVDPRLAKMLIVSPDFKCSNEILSISAMLSVPSCFVRPLDAEAKAKFRHIDGDHLTLLNVYEAFKFNAGEKDWCVENCIDYKSMMRADKMRSRLHDLMSRFSIRCFSSDVGSVDYYINIRKAMIAGSRVARLQRGGYYLTEDEHVVQLHPFCVLEHKPECIIYHSLSADKRLIQTITTIQDDWA